jgi:tRNA-(ms[2]io[6]A)-hydroxylase
MKAKDKLPLAAPSATGKRRLPLLPKDEVADESDAERPPWHWSAIGAVAIFVIWLPLTFLTAVLGKRLLGDAADPAAASLAARFGLAAANLLVFALASFGGGALVGRFGGKAGLKEATVAGLATAAIAWATIAAQGVALTLGVSMLVVLVTIGAGAARIGGFVGLKQRRP